MSDRAHERERAVVPDARDGRPRAGRRQERLPGRDGRATWPRRGARARRLRHDRRRVPRFLGDRRAGRADHRAAGGPRHRRRRARWPRSAQQIRDGDRRAAASRPTSRPTSATAYDDARRRATTEASLRGAVERDRRGPAGRVVRRAAGDLPQHPRHRRVLHAIREVFASLYNDRAIAYRVHHDFDHDDVALSAGVQRMVRSDVGASGVMFTMDTESGFDDAVFITSSLRARRGGRAGRGQPRRVLRLQARAARRAGRRSSSAAWAARRPRWSTPTTPSVGQHHRVRRRRPRPSGGCSASPTTRSSELARHALAIEEHYGRPMDIEWGKDGVDGELYILQARPETVQSRQAGGNAAAVPARTSAGRCSSRAARSGRRSAPARCGC